MEALLSSSPWGEREEQEGKSRRRVSERARGCGKKAAASSSLVPYLEVLLINVRQRFDVMPTSHPHPPVQCDGHRRCIWQNDLHPGEFLLELRHDVGPTSLGTVAQPMQEE